MLDSFNRRIDYLRVSVTDLCNLRCSYCMPAEGIRKLEHSQILSYERIAEVVATGVRLGIRKVRLTGGEPLVRRNLEALVEMLKKIPGIGELALTTNGQLLGKFAPVLRERGLDRLNVSLDTLRPDRYEQITRGGDIEKVFAGIRAAREAGFINTKINMVLIAGFNLDEVLPMARFCKDNNLTLQRISRYHLGNRNGAEKYLSERPLPCVQCNRLRLTADGFIKPCLFSDIEIKVDFGNIERAFLEALDKKPFAGESCSNRENYQIGG